MIRKFKGIEDLQGNLVTKSGVKVTQVKLFNVNAKYPIVGFIEGEQAPTFWTIDGHFLDGDDDALNLFVEEKKFYANVYRLSNGRVKVGVVRDSVESCEKHMIEDEFQKFERIIEL